MSRSENRRAVTLGDGGLRLESSLTPISDSYDGDQALIQVLSCCLCESDTHRIFHGKAHKYPLVVGHEFAGTVVEAPRNSKLKHGDLVAVFPLLPCLACPSCSARSYNLCGSYDYFGSRRDGGLQDLLFVPTWNLFPITQGVSAANASLVETCAVALHALRKLDLASPGKLAILGGGFLARVAVDLLNFSHKLNAITIFDRNKVNIDYFRGEGVSARELDFKIGLDKGDTDQNTFSHVLDFVSSSESFALALDLLAPHGQYCLVGNPKGDLNVQSDRFSQILRKELAFFGSWNSDFSQSQSDWSEIVRLLTTGFNPAKFITNSVELEELPGFVQNYFSVNGRLPRKLQVRFESN